MIARPLTIGGVELESNLVLAPIAGYCDLAFRLCCREQGGVGLACTDLLSPQGLLRGTAQSLDLARTCDEDTPVGMQLYGSDPRIMAEGAVWAADHGATIVDINMGCPVDKVVKKDGGSKLMCDADLARRIVEAVRLALPTDIPLTVKMRLGWDEDARQNDLAGMLARRLVGAGAAAITVHGRTTEQRFKGACRLDGIRRVVEAVRGMVVPGTRGHVPVIGNGDVREPRDAIKMLRETGCDGVMIGRGALSTPWIFRDAWALQTSGRIQPEPSDAEKIEIVRRFFERMRLHRGDRYALHQITRRISWLGKRINGGCCKELKEAVRLAGTPGQVHAALDAFLERRERIQVGSCGLTAGG
ncbi:MAG: tRNA-dihydrouridine synthase [Planctomycetes bacterium]|nr:tRNA-dihydrouridine synthase [Planctomycetota bacterium]